MSDDNVSSKLLWNHHMTQLSVLTWCKKSRQLVPGDKFAPCLILQDLPSYLLSPNPAFWGQCQAPEDYGKCAHVSFQRGAAFPNPSFWGQCQTLLLASSRHQYQHANQCSCCSTGRAPIFWIIFPSVEEFLMHPSEVHIFFWDLSPIWAMRQYFSDATVLPGVMDSKYELSPKR